MEATQDLDLEHVSSRSLEVPAPIFQQQAILKIVRKNGKEESHSLGKGVTKIGRAPFNDIILNEGSISNGHCEIEISNGFHFIKDKKSTNKTKLGTAESSMVALEPQTRYQLAHGNQLMLGEIKCQYFIATQLPVKTESTLQPTQLSSQATIPMENSQVNSLARQSTLPIAPQTPPSSKSIALSTPSQSTPSTSTIIPPSPIPISPAPTSQVTKPTPPSPIPNQPPLPVSKPIPILTANQTPSRPSPSPSKVAGHANIPPSLRAKAEPAPTETAGPTQIAANRRTIVPTTSFVASGGELETDELLHEMLGFTGSPSTPVDDHTSMRRRSKNSNDATQQVDATLEASRPFIFDSASSCSGSVPDNSQGSKDASGTIACEPDHTDLKAGIAKGGSASATLPYDPNANANENSRLQRANSSTTLPYEPVPPVGIVKEIPQLKSGDSSATLPYDPNVSGKIDGAVYDKKPNDQTIAYSDSESTIAYDSNAQQPKSVDTTAISGAHQGGEAVPDNGATQLACDLNETQLDLNEPAEETQIAINAEPTQLAIDEAGETQIARDEPTQIAWGDAGATQLAGDLNETQIAIDEAGETQLAGAEPTQLASDEPTQVGWTDLNAGETQIAIEEAGETQLAVGDTQHAGVEPTQLATDEPTQIAEWGDAGGANTSGLAQLASDDNRTQAYGDFSATQLCEDPAGMQATDSHPTRTAMPPPTSTPTKKSSSTKLLTKTNSGQLNIPPSLAHLHSSSPSPNVNMHEPTQPMQDSEGSDVTDYGASAEVFGSDIVQVYEPTLNMNDSEGSSEHDKPPSLPLSPIRSASPNTSTSSLSRTGSQIKRELEAQDANSNAPSATAKARTTRSTQEVLQNTSHEANLPPSLRKNLSGNTKPQVDPTTATLELGDESSVEVGTSAGLDTQEYDGDITVDEIEPAVKQEKISAQSPVTQHKVLDPSAATQAYDDDDDILSMVDARLDSSNSKVLSSQQKDEHEDTSLSPFSSSLFSKPSKGKRAEDAHEGEGENLSISAFESSYDSVLDYPMEFEPTQETKAKRKPVRQEPTTAAAAKKSKFVAQVEAKRKLDQVANETSPDKITKKLNTNNNNNNTTTATTTTTADTQTTPPRAAKNTAQVKPSPTPKRRGGRQSKITPQTSPNSSPVPSPTPPPPSFEPVDVPPPSPPPPEPSPTPTRRSTRKQTASQSKTTSQSSLSQSPVPSPTITAEAPSSPIPTPTRKSSRKQSTPPATPLQSPSPTPEPAKRGRKPKPATVKTEDAEPPSLTSNTSSLTISPTTSATSSSGSLSSFDMTPRTRTRRQNSGETPEALKKGPSFGSGTCIVFTGINPNTVQKYAEVIQSLGGTTSDQVTENCTHLITAKVMRTAKFLTSVALGKHIVVQKWLDDSRRAKYFLDESKYILHDKDAEVEGNFSLQKSLAKARASKLMTGLSFYLTPSLDELRGAIVASGGEVLTHAPKKFSENVKIVSTESEEDKPIYAHLHDMGFSVYNRAFISNGILQQHLDYHTNLLPKVRGSR